MRAEAAHFPGLDMEWWQWILLGVLATWTPTVLLLAWLLCQYKPEHVEHGHEHEHGQVLA
jgi:hypothetical protein